MKNKDFRIEYTDEETTIIFYGDKEVYRWYDNANMDYPEDLTWSRMISEVFFKGVELGQKIEKEKK